MVLTDTAAADVANGWTVRAYLTWAADALAGAIAITLPWSTSATSILIVLWALVLLPSLDRESLRVMAHPAASLCGVLWLIAALGFLWSSAPMPDRLAAFKNMQKLLVVPLLFVEFRRSDRGMRVLKWGFLLSCTALLVVSWAVWLWPSAALRYLGLGVPGQLYTPGVPVRDYIIQGNEFIMCAFGLTHCAISAVQNGRRLIAVASAILTFLFLANVFFVAAGRTSLVVYVVLLLILAFQRFGRTGGLGFALVGLLLTAGAFASSSYLQGRAFSVIDEITHYRETNAETSTGLRLEFWKKSVDLIAASPIIGHGTGSITDLFRGLASGETGASSVVTGNPHNMTLEIAVQFGLVGVVALYAMWAAQLMLFRGSGFPEWMGVAVVVQGFVGSLSLSYLFDFTTGTTYLFGVGVLGGTVMRKREIEGMTHGSGAP
jgi:hypothetical protein